MTLDLNEKEINLERKEITIIEKIYTAPMNHHFCGLVPGRIADGSK